MTQQRNRRAGFTLVELLAVMVVLGILAGMVTVALASVQETARAAKTRAIISSIDEVLRGKWEQYQVRPFSVTPPPKPSGYLPTQSAELRPVEAARIRLMMVRDLMRMELPDRQADISTGPMTISAVVHPTGMPTSFTSVIMPWAETALHLSYQDRMSAGWTAEHQSAECLYLILSTTFQNGISGLEMIPPGNIGDTDGDGMLEILDGWGQPLGFLRWPVGAATGDDFTLTPDEYATLSSDEFDPFRADYGYYDSSIQDAFSLRPLVVSAGPDGVFDIRFTKSSGDPYVYSEKTWPGTGRPSPYYFIDPYQRHDGDGEAFGTPVDQDGDGKISSDNISNYNLAVSS